MSDPTPPPAKMEVEGLNAWYSGRQALYDVTINIPDGAITAIIGPSGCGKSTFLRCLNRLHDEVPGSKVTGSIRLDGEDIRTSDAVSVRTRVGMVFQRPTAFPNMSIYENVAAGLRLLGVRHRKQLDEGVVEALVLAGLWEEVKDQIDAPGISLSGGQQQRLSIARALATQPEVLLLDEPCSALDPIATSKIESLLLHLKKRFTVVIVTHNLAQAHRVSDFTAFFYLGKLVELDTTAKIFSTPREKLTENYVGGRFG